MTLLKSKYEEECYHISTDEYDKLEDMHSKTSDHCLFYDNNGIVCLIIHGDEKHHKVMYNGKLRTSEELSTLIREELSIPYNTNIVVRVFCCYGAYLGGYIDKHTIIQSAFYNKPALNLLYDDCIAHFSYN